MLEIVSVALHTNAITHVLCTNRNKDFSFSGSLQQFRNNLEIKVLLMPLALGAEGLDLVVASRIFILEPLMNIYQEAQAVNRIHRLGQLKNTFIHKYIISDTIEQQIFNLQQQHITNNTNSDDNNEILLKSNSSSNSKHHSKRKDDDTTTIEELYYILGL